MARSSSLLRGVCKSSGVLLAQRSVSERLITPPHQGRAVLSQEGLGETLECEVGTLQPGGEGAQAGPCAQHLPCPEQGGGQDPLRGCASGGVASVSSSTATVATFLPSGLG